VLSALADTAAVYAILPALGADERMTSIEFKVNFLAAARPNGGEVIGRSELVRRGRTVAVVRSDVSQGATHVLTGLFTYVILQGAGISSR
jgi:acyl-coenzyme A thioesterase PaaI-like protein